MVFFLQCLLLLTTTAASTSYGSTLTMSNGTITFSTNYDFYGNVSVSATKDSYLSDVTELNQPTAYYDDISTFDPDSTDPIYVNGKVYYLNQVYPHVFPPHQKPTVSNYKEPWWLTLLSCVGAAAGIIVASYGIGFLAWWFIYVDLYNRTWRMTMEEFEEFMWEKLGIPPPSEEVHDEYDSTMPPEDVDEDEIYPPSDDEYENNILPSCEGDYQKDIHRS